jgi:hypothetical protein
LSEYNPIVIVIKKPRDLRPKNFDSSQLDSSVFEGDYKVLDTQNDEDAKTTPSQSPDLKIKVKGSLKPESKAKKKDQYRYTLDTYYAKKKEE